MPIAPAHPGQSRDRNAGIFVMSNRFNHLKRKSPQAEQIGARRAMIDADKLAFGLCQGHPSRVCFQRQLHFVFEQAPKEQETHVV